MVAKSKQGIFISQEKYILGPPTGVKHARNLGSKAYNTPIDPNQILGDDEVVVGGRYQRLVGRLIYLSHTHPDIAFTVSFVNQFIRAPRESHYMAVIRILVYLKPTLGKGPILW